MSQSSRTILPVSPQSVSGQPDANQKTSGALTGFEILSSRATLHGAHVYGGTLHGGTVPGGTLHGSAVLGGMLQGALLHAPAPPTPTELGLQAPAPALPDRLREVDLKLSHERELVVDALEIAAYLEADGLSDESLRGRYNAGGLFHAAELLFAQRGSGRALNRLAQLPLPAFPWHMLLRGPLYLLPGLAGLLITRPLGVGAAAAFIFAAAFGWGWSMTIAGLRYSEPFAVPGRAMRAALWMAGVMGTLGGGITALLLAGTSHLLLGALSGGAVSLATAASGILLALGRTGLSAGALGLPMLVAVVVHVSLLPVSGSMVIDASAVPSSFIAAEGEGITGAVGNAGAETVSVSLVAPLVALALLAAAPVLAVLHVTRTPGMLPVTWAVLRPHLRLATYGWAMALTFVGFNSQLGAWPLLPIILSAGLLEAGVWHSQERLQHAARSLRDLTELRWRGRVTVPVVAALYAVILAVAVLLAHWSGIVPQLSGITPGTQLGVALLGSAFLLSAWLANQRQVALLFGVWLVAAVLTFTAALPLPLISLALVLTFLLSALNALNDPRSYR